MSLIVLALAAGSPYGAVRYLWALRPTDAQMGENVWAVFEGFGFAPSLYLTTEFAWEE